MTISVRVIADKKGLKHHISLTGGAVGATVMAVPMTFSDPVRYYLMMSFIL